MFVLELSKPSGRVPGRGRSDGQAGRLPDLLALRRRLAPDEHRRRSRRRGAGDRRRAARADARARRAATSRTRSRCAPSNAPAIALYERFGFRSAGHPAALLPRHRRGRRDHVADRPRRHRPPARPGDPRARDQLRRHVRGGRSPATARSASNVISSQGIHDRYGGVVPEIASRHHLELIGAVVDDALRTAGISLTTSSWSRSRAVPAWSAALLVGRRHAPRRWPPRTSCRSRPSTTCTATSRRASSAPDAVRAAVPEPDRQRRAHAARARDATTGPDSRCSARRSTTPPARRSTRARGCSGSAIRAARRSSGWPRDGDPEAFAFPDRARGCAGSTSRSPG